MNTRAKELNEMFVNVLKQVNAYGDVYYLEYDVTTSKDSEDLETHLHSWYFTSKFHCFDFADQKRFLNLAASSSITPWIVIRKGEIAYEFTYFEHN